MLVLLARGEAPGCPMTARAVRRGETIHDTTLGRPEPHMVLSPCDHRAVGYYCDACAMILANIGQLTLHIQEYAPKRGDHHRIAVWCSACRLFREADQAQLDALTGQHQPSEPSHVEA